MALFIVPFSSFQEDLESKCAKKKWAGNETRGLCRRKNKSKLNTKFPVVVLQMDKCNDLKPCVIHVSHSSTDLMGVCLPYPRSHELPQRPPSAHQWTEGIAYPDDNKKHSKFFVPFTDFSVHFCRLISNHCVLLTRHGHTPVNGFLFVLMNHPVPEKSISIWCFEGIMQSFEALPLSQQLCA